MTAKTKDTEIYTYSYGPQQKLKLRVSNSRVAIRTKSRKDIVEAIDKIDLFDSVKVTNKTGSKNKKIKKGFGAQLQGAKVEIKMSKGRRKLVQETSFPESGVSVVKVPTTSLLGKKFRRKAREKVRQELKKDGHLQFAGRVLLDPQSKEEVLYTGNVILKFNGTLEGEDRDKFFATHSLKRKTDDELLPNMHFLEPGEKLGLSIFEFCENLSASDEVSYCYPELIRPPSRRNLALELKPVEDGFHEFQWHLRPSATEDETKFISDAHCYIVDAWTYANSKDESKGKGKGITIAVIDDGFELDHTDFEGYHPAGKNFSADPRNKDPWPQDPYKYRGITENHGTACAGIACGNDRNGTSGVAPEAQLLPIRLSCGIGSVLEARAIRYAVDQGADIISCSWGPRDGDYDDPNDPRHTTYKPLPPHTREAIEYANEKGVVIVWAAGNGNEDIKYDGYASNENVIAVGACNDHSQRCKYSDYGKNLTCVFPSGDVAEVDTHFKGIWTTDRHGGEGFNNYNYYEGFTGTSASAPGVAGLIALLLELEPDLTPKEVKQRLQDSCEKIDPDNADYDENGHSIYYGYGRPNAVWLLDPHKKLKDLRASQDKLGE